MRAAQQIGIIEGVNIPPWVLRAGGILPSVDLDTPNNRAWVNGTGLVPISSLLSITRSATVTNLLPTSAAGASFLTFGANTLAIDPGSGLNIFSSKNNLLNCLAPVTQTTASLAAGTYTLWVNGSGSATSSAGTAVGTGFGTATNGSVNTFTLSAPGTVVVTVSGSLNAFQLEPMAAGTPLIVTTSAPVVRADNVTAAGVLLSALIAAQGSVLFSSIPGANGTTRVQLGYSTGTSTPLYFNNSANVLTSFANSTALLTANALNAGSVNKSALGFSSAGRSIVLNNGTVATDTNALSTSTGVMIGNGGGTNYLNGPDSRLTVFSPRFPDAALKALTV